MKKFDTAYVTIYYGIPIASAIILCFLGFAFMPVFIFIGFSAFFAIPFIVPILLKKNLEKNALELEKTFAQQGFNYQQKFTSNSGIFYIDLSGRLAVIWKLNPKELNFVNLATLSNVGTNDGKQLRGTALVSCQFYLEGKRYKIYTLRVSNGQYAMNSPQVLEAISKADHLCELLNTAKKNALSAESR